MARLKATPKTFAEASQVLGNRCSVKLGHNTFLESYVDGTQVDRICVRLHSTNIVTFYPDGRVELRTGGWRTTTTKDRINQFITGRVYQKNYDWYYVGHGFDGQLAWDSPDDFVEGIIVNRSNGQVK